MSKIVDKVYEEIARHSKIITSLTQRLDWIKKEMPWLLEDDPDWVSISGYELSLDFGDELPKGWLQKLRRDTGAETLNAYQSEKNMRISHSVYIENHRFSICEIHGKARQKCHTAKVMTKPQAKVIEYCGDFPKDQYDLVEVIEEN